MANPKRVDSFAERQKIKGVKAKIGRRYICGCGGDRWLATYQRRLRLRFVHVRAGADYRQRTSASCEPEFCQMITDANLVDPQDDGSEPMQWRCFHCSEVFTTQHEAQLHFGKGEFYDAICQVDGERFRELEYTVRMYREEDTELHREIHRLHAHYGNAMRQEEEKGYARGIADMQAQFQIAVALAYRASKDLYRGPPRNSDYDREADITAQIDKMCRDFPMPQASDSCGDLTNKGD